jgi:uncharacterized protein with von Willebrand factor type A (vWA) domain
VIPEGASAADRSASSPGGVEREGQSASPADGRAERLIAGFAAALRAGGLPVATGSVILFAEALGLLGLADIQRVYWAGRACFLSRPEDIVVYDKVFALYWQGEAVAGTDAWVPPPERVTLLIDDLDAEDDPPEGGGTVPDSDPVQALRYSAREVLGERDLGGLTADEWAEAERLISELRCTAEMRPSRRLEASRRRNGPRPHLRATLRRNMRHAGIPMRLAWQEPSQRPRRVVYLLDVSGSMDPYARALIRLAHAAVASRSGGEVEVFTIGTRLTRVTREMSGRDPEAALRAASRAVTDLSGGTRIGLSLQQFNEEWGVRGMARGAIVVVCSDGWDRGDPELVAAEMARLARAARRVIWVNPLKASPGYAPLARGMAAALPHVDEFIEGHSVASLQHLAKLLGAGGRPQRRTQLRPSTELQGSAAT